MVPEKLDDCEDPVFVKFWNFLFKGPQIAAQVPMNVGSRVCTSGPTRNVVSVDAIVSQVPLKQTFISESTIFGNDHPSEARDVLGRTLLAASMNVVFPMLDQL